MVLVRYAIFRAAGRADWPTEIFVGIFQKSPIISIDKWRDLSYNILVAR